MRVSWVMLVLCVMGLGCEPATKTKAQASSGKPTVVVTTTMLRDIAAQIAGDAVTVKGIMRPGGDPHLYQPRPSDAKMIASSQMVVTNGLHLEGWIDDLVRNAGGTRPVVVAAEGIEAIKMEGSPGGVDPHFWFDVVQVQKAAQNVTKGLLNIAPISTRDGIKARAKAYEERLAKLHVWVGARLQTIPKQNRVMITSHDAFNYLGRAYDIEVVGIQGSSTEQEASQRDVANTIELVKKREVKAIYVETSVNPALIKQVAAETGVKVLGPLFSDSTGPVDSPASSYIGMVVENTRLLTEGLGGTYAPFEAAK